MEEAQADAQGARQRGDEHEKRQVTALTVLMSKLTNKLSTLLSANALTNDLWNVRHDSAKELSACKEAHLAELGKTVAGVNAMVNYQVEQAKREVEAQNKTVE